MALALVLALNMWALSRCQRSLFHLHLFSLHGISAIWGVSRAAHRRDLTALRVHDR